MCSMLYYARQYLLCCSQKYNGNPGAGSVLRMAASIGIYFGCYLRHGVKIGVRRRF